MILTIRTDKPEAEIGLLSSTGEKLEYKIWQAHRELAETIHKTIKELLDKQNKDWQDISGVICYGGPGSFTGLRIGAAVANSVATSLAVPLAQSSNDDWIEQGLDFINQGNDQVALPDYGSEPHTTTQKK